MKRIMLLAVACCFSASVAFAQQSATTPAAATPSVETIKGIIIDNQCANAQKPENLAAFVKTHPKSCALMPACEASGYSIYADGKLMKFSKESNAKVVEFLKKPESKLAVTITAKKEKDEISLFTIENQK